MPTIDFPASPSLNDEYSFGGKTWKYNGIGWALVDQSGDVTKVGTPADNQVGVWTGDGTIEGDTALTFDTSTDTLTIAASGNLAFGAVTVIDDNAGTTTLQNIDAVDATTESTIEASIDTLANLTSVQGRTLALADAGADAVFGWDDSANQYANLSAADARAALGLATTDSPLFTAVDVGNADTTVARSGAGDISVEGNVVYRAGGTDVPVTDGGTGRSTSTTAYGLIAAGTTATGAHQTLAAGATTEILVGGGAAALPVWTTAQGSGAPVRATSPTLTTPNIGTPSAGTLTNCTGLPATGLVADTTTAVGFGSIELGHASDTTLARAATGRVTVEGVELLRPASQSDMETATSNIVGVTPGTQQWHPTAAKCWCQFNVSGTIAASLNMTSVTDNGTGTWTPTINTDFSSANYAVVACGGIGAAAYIIYNIAAHGAGTIQINCASGSNVATDPATVAEIYFVAFGDL